MKQPGSHQVHYVQIALDQQASFAPTRPYHLRASTTMGPTRIFGPCHKVDPPTRYSKLAMLMLEVGHPPPDNSPSGPVPYGVVLQGIEAITEWSMDYVKACRLAVEPVSP